ncbi:lipoprotein-releasing system ATP-binding protein LolD [Candidatus Saccharibacteria bacterium]|nr:MAG: lipoprotein-releasing system ATP-binding protein LolD [Candidatus Saccharibacteria bacterium]
MLMNIIEISNLSKQFKDKVIFSDVNLEIEKGEFILLKGDSGAGKSTLLNIIGGIEKPDSGEIIINNKNVNKLKAKEQARFYRKEVGFIFQDFYLHPHLNVSENISLAGVFANLAQKEVDERVGKITKVLKIEDILKSKIDEISGGQAERVCIARAIFMSPSIILADEPTNNLDEKNAENAVKILHTISKAMNITVIISSHNQMVERYADRIIKLSGGVIS